ncbi:hypothetical protein RMATCC62417_12342 [Rhizopus microsporus]|nr:hypothetical protein RMATCC62417_12342 [Rhizopus microsporus]
MRHIAEGGSWVKDGSREKYGLNIASFISEHKEHLLFYLAGGSREFADNNSSSQKVKTGSFAVFIHCNNLLASGAKPFLGLVRESSVQRLNLHNSSSQEDFKSGFLIMEAATTPHSNIFLGFLDVEFTLDIFELSGNYILINLNKFGSY